MTTAPWRDAGRTVPRTRLVHQAAGQRIVLLEAGGGYGKSTLSQQVVASLEVVPARARLRSDGLGPGALLWLVREALTRVGLDEAAGVLTATEPDPSGLPEALHDGLCEVDTPVALVLDDVHRLDDDGAKLLAALVDELPAPHRLIASARVLADPVRDRAARPDALLLGSDALAFTAEEVVALAASEGLALDHIDAQALVRATGGWPAALRLMLPRLHETVDPSAAVARLVGELTTVAALVDRLLEPLPAATRTAAAQLAHLPLLDRTVAAEALGAPDLLAELAAVGLPLSQTRDGWWVLPDPIREQLGRRAGVETAVARAAAAVYDRRDERLAALRVLLQAGADADAVRLAGGWPSKVATRLGAEPLRRLVAAVDDAALAADVRVLVHLSRCHGLAADPSARQQVLERAESLPVDARDQREIAAERLAHDVWVGHSEGIEERARALLDTAEAGQRAVRAKATEALAFVAATSRDVPGLRRADHLLGDTMALWDQLDEPEQRAHVALKRALIVAWPLGYHDEAIDLVDTCLAGVGAHSRQRAQALTFKAFMLTYAGRHPEAEACVDEAEVLARRLRLGTAQAYAAWGRARIASHRGEAEATERALRSAEQAGSRMIDTGGGAFLLADGAQLLDRVGRTDLAWAWLRRAQDRDDGSLGLVPLAAFALHARSGDPAQAQDHLARARALPAVEPREEWRVALLEGEAARREGERTRAAERTRQALALAQRTDVPEVPWIRERDLIERLHPLLDEDSDRDATEPLTVRLLGGFEVRRGHTDRTPPPGRLAAAVKVVALRGGRASVEAVITDLWPEASPETGRERLRQLLARLRRASGELLVRHGDVLALPDDAVIDHETFVAAAREALAHPGVGSVEPARRALRHPVELLPEDAAEEWAQAPRREAHRLRLAVLDRLAADSDQAGDRQAAITALEEALALAPEDHARAGRAAALLEAEGREGAARALRRRHGLG